MAEESSGEQHYLVPSHLETQQSIGPFPARFLMPTLYAGVFLGIPLGYTAWQATNGLLPPTIGAALLPPLLISPYTAWWLKPPAEHGTFAALRFVKRTYRAQLPTSPATPVAIYRMPTINLETASDEARHQARAQWGAILNGLTHPIKIVIRGRPLTTLPVVEALRNHPLEVARDLGAWFESELAQHSLIDRDRLLVVPAQNESELAFRTTALEKALRQAHLEASRVPAEDVPLLRTLTWNPQATEARDGPEVMEEGTTEVQADGWWTRAYALGQFPAAILTNWASPLFAGDEALDIAIDVVPQNETYVKAWVVDVKIRQLETSNPSAARMVALEQLTDLRYALEHRYTKPFNVAVTVLVRGSSRQDVRKRSRKTEDYVKTLGGKLHNLRWEQGDGLLQLDPVRTKPMTGRTHLVDTRTVSRTYPWSDGYLQLPNGVPWGNAGNRPCIFTPYVSTSKGPHMSWYGATNAGKGMGFHILTSRLHLVKGIRIFGIDQDEQHEHCGRFLEYLGGRKLTPRDARDAREIVLHRDDGVVILDLSEVDEAHVGAIFAAWTNVIKQHMLAHPGRSIVFVDEAITVSEDPAGERAMRQAVQRSRHWGQSFHVLTQRPSSWFGTAVGRAVQGNCDAWWCGAQQPRELAEVADALELSADEKGMVRRAGIGTGLLVSGLRRVWLDLFDRLSAREHAAFHSDPVVEAEPIPIRKEGVS